MNEAGNKQTQIPRYAKSLEFKAQKLIETHELNMF